MKPIHIKKELIFVHHSTNNNVKRVIVKIDNTENIIYHDDLLDPNILIAIGLSNDDLNLCDNFLKKGD